MSIRSVWDSQQQKREMSRQNKYFTQYYISFLRKHESKAERNSNATGEIYLSCQWWPVNKLLNNKKKLSPFQEPIYHLNLPAPTDGYFRLLQLQIKNQVFVQTQRYHIISKHIVLPVNLSGHWVMWSQGAAKSLVMFPKSQ